MRPIVTPGRQAWREWMASARHFITFLYPIMGPEIPIALWIPEDRVPHSRGRIR